jgi:hypothetical protein
MKHIFSATAAVALAAPAVAEAQEKQLCCGMKFVMTFSDAAPEVKLVVLALWVAALASAVVWIRKLAKLRRSEPQDFGRVLAFLVGWRSAGPMLAAGLAAYVLMNFFVALYSYPPVPASQAYGPALAEVGMILWAGFTAGAVAALAHAHLSARALRS